jgi:predicted RNase H-like HicB family nuclease
MKTYRFTVVIEKEPEDPGYFAYCPALPGCFGAGLTIDETKEDMRKAIALHLESLRAHGDPLPGEDHESTITELALEIPA